MASVAEAVLAVPAASVSGGGTLAISLQIPLCALHTDRWHLVEQYFAHAHLPHLLNFFVLVKDTFVPQPSQVSAG